MRHIVFVCALAASTLARAIPAETPAAPQPAARIPLITAGKPACVIISSPEAQTKRAASRLADYLNEQCGARPSILTETALPEDPRQTLIVLDGSLEHPLLSRLGISLDVPSDRPDAYHLRALQIGKRPVIAVAGRAETGAKFGAYRLMEEMDLEHGEASVGSLDIVASPFFKTRSVSLFNIWRVPVEVVRQCNLESWPVEKIQRNVDMYDVFGFNALETHDRFHEGFLKAVYGITRKEWREKVHAMCDRAHADGMTMFFRQWGNSIENPVTELKDGYTPFGFTNLAPDIPSERKRWEAEIRDYAATNYASCIDHLIGHWADAGGIHPGSHATIKDAMLLHNELRAAFLAINPKIDTSFNLWGLPNPRGKRGWPGYVDVRSITGAGILAKDVIIAQTTRAYTHAYSEKITQQILDDGYRPAVWSWRRGDTEVRFGDPGLRIRIHGVMGDYFHGLPDSARKLEWHNIERNHHGIANDVNYYVASKLMWDPKTDVDAALNKYCSLVFGKPNAAAVAQAFLVIEASRDVQKDVSRSIIEHPAAGADRARRALAALEVVKLPPGHRSRLPSVTSPEEMLQELRGTLAVIAENAEIAATQLPALDNLLRGGQSEKAKALAAELNEQAGKWFGAISGGMEGLWLKETVAARLKGKAGEKAHDWFGFWTRNLASFEQKDSQYTIGGQGKAPATALLKLQPPARHRVEFHFQCLVASSGKARNAGFAFGAGRNMDDLVRCEAFIRGRELRLRGAKLQKPATVAAPDLDPSQPLPCAVTIDLDRHLLNFKAGAYSARAELDPSVREVGWYGYVVEHTRTRFDQITVSRAE